MKDDYTTNSPHYLTHFSSNCWENVLFELGSKRLKRRWNLLGHQVAEYKRDTVCWEAGAGGNKEGFLPRVGHRQSLPTQKDGLRLRSWLKNTVQLLRDVCVARTVKALSLTLHLTVHKFGSLNKNQETVKIRTSCANQASHQGIHWGAVYTRANTLIWIRWASALFPGYWIITDSSKLV